MTTAAMQHTPGPWSYEETTLGICRLIVTVEDVQAFKVSPDAQGDHAIAYVPCDAARDEQEANARLIAAAPKLLDACNLAVMMLGVEAQIHRENQAPKKAEAVEKAIGVIRAAIAKATEGAN